MPYIIFIKSKKLNTLFNQKKCINLFKIQKKFPKTSKVIIIAKNFCAFLNKNVFTAEFT